MYRICNKSYGAFSVAISQNALVSILNFSFVCRLMSYLVKPSAMVLILLNRVFNKQICCIGYHISNFVFNISLQFTRCQKIVMACYVI